MKHCPQTRHQEDQMQKKKSKTCLKEIAQNIEIMTRQVLLARCFFQMLLHQLMTQILLPTAEGGIDDSIVLLSIADRIIGDTSVQLLMEILATTIITYLLLMEVLVTLVVMLFITVTVVGHTGMTDRSIDDSLVLLSTANGGNCETLVLLSTAEVVSVTEWLTAVNHSVTETTAEGGFDDV